jgi:diguanylate cyclase (GGDEF)-like protein
MFYLFIAPVAYGVSVKRKWLIVLPIFTLVEYVWLFSFINNHVYQAVGRNLVSNCISFSVAFIFVFAYVNYFANIAVKYNKRLLKLTYHDELTGLFNRRKLDVDLSGKRFKYCIMIDIDNFHDCNNENGHQFGDLVLKKFADICLFLSSDEFRIYRYGGEEFLILSRLNTEETLKKLKGIQNLFYKSYGITLSIGVSLNNDYGTWQEIVKQADENMFFVKHNGKNNISFDGLHLVDKKS